MNTALLSGTRVSALYASLSEQPSLTYSSRALYRHAAHTVPNIAPQIADGIDGIDVIEMLALAALDTQTTRSHALATQNVGLLQRNIQTTIKAAEALLAALPDGDVQPLTWARLGRNLLVAVGVVAKASPAAGALIASALDDLGEQEAADMIRARSLAAAAAQISKGEPND